MHTHITYQRICNINYEKNYFSELLPSPPENVEVEPLTEKSLNVSWAYPISNTETITKYIINVTSLRSFDAHLIDPADTPSTVTSHSVQVSVPASQHSAVLNNLSAFTMYEVTVTAQNSHGSSLPSYVVRSLTLTSGKMKPTAVAESPVLPDIRGCCVAKGITHKTCLDKLCDPGKVFRIFLFLWLIAMKVKHF